MGADSYQTSERIHTPVEGNQHPVEPDPRTQWPDAQLAGTALTVSKMRVVTVAMSLWTTYHIHGVPTSIAQLPVFPIHGDSGDISRTGRGLPRDTDAGFIHIHLLGDGTDAFGHDMMPVVIGCTGIR